MPKITEMWAYVADDSGPDDEGVTAFFTGQGWMPMVGADKQRMESLRPIAMDLAKNGKPIKLIRFTVREDIEIIK